MKTFISLSGGVESTTMNLIISFSGGLTSTYMTRLILDSEKYAEYQKVCVFANTGKEREETLEFVDRCDKEWGLGIVWIEADIQDFGTGTTYKIVDFQSASRNGEPFEAVIEKYGFTNKDAPHCSRELKERPIKKFAQSLGDWQIAIGFRADERKRMKRKPGYIYPLIEDFTITNRDVKEFWNAQPFTLNLNPYEGNCDLCWKKSLAKRLRIISENPGLADWWEEQEKRDGEYIFDRDDNPISKMREMARIKDTQMSIDFDEPQCSCFSNI